MLIFAVLLTCLMITVIIADFTRYIIPNWLVGIVLLLYPVMVYFSPARPDWQGALLIAIGVFAVGFLLFAVGAMGGGDIKLLTATVLWIGKMNAIMFFLWVSILGGILAIALWLLRYMIPYALSKLKNPPPIPRVFTIGEPVPYGVAIAIVFLVLLWTGKIPGIIIP